jgi:N-carbamoyl-L-amino-acid hydrolase
MKKIFFLLLLLPTFSPAQTLIQADPHRMEARIQALAQFGLQPNGGVMRPGFSEEDIKARQYVMDLMKKMKLDVHIDAAGNLIGRRAGQDNDQPYISFGSHIDAVPNGGKYDGDVGVVAALEVIELLNENNIQTDHPLEVIVFVAEEDGLFGSTGMSGSLTETDLNFEGNSGKTVRQGIRDVGGNPEQLGQAVRKKGEILAFIELHIEQGATLFSEKLDIGVVQGIVGIEEWAITVEGMTNHAGTTPMNVRQDALLAASKLVVAINEAVKSFPGAQVGTVGTLNVEPNVSNVVPGKVTMTLEMRDLSNDKIQQVYQLIQPQMYRIEKETKTKITVKKELTHGPALTDMRLQDLIEQSAEELGFSNKRMPSGAGHDSQEMAKVAPMGMIFVPSRNGISHSPEEYTSPEDMAKGAGVLLRTVLKLDGKGL